MSDEHVLDDLSKGELRRLYFHLREASDRLDRARDILDEHNLVDEWDGDYGFMFAFTDGQAQVNDVYTEVLREYDDRHSDDE
ncbi:hypothetical protein PN419_00530 [Halorubrum ezzemoulense]|uniref:hypothetical protein n=1 Tax=Halorubrum ezzemoulense TaxID=337243 RepID=UPI00232B6134|nr:hypothetical protein [Halorubrum ezzemoulense]MDB9247493.1 hypothetical protein [Halorubrum ezzemoulense]MDB9258598.1 hypothetical protein [Halorubrum ezzemoulense]MDB9264543.1 hypothetical protein [Halorubrum ezzemoulense]MDB9268959.1 hypothetical protein [Halorubrum ezzemoulense]MDB9271511.1 hypothetical protein [Halorubrum ezzemoulense]